MNKTEKTAGTMFSEGMSLVGKAVAKKTKSVLGSVAGTAGSVASAAVTTVVAAPELIHGAARKLDQGIKHLTQEGEEAGIAISDAVIEGVSDATLKASGVITRVRQGLQEETA